METTLESLLSTLRSLRARPVLVTGPQRSGTTIAAHILAQELNWPYVDEDDYGIHDLPTVNEPCVVQGPGLMHVADRFDGIIVVMRRRLEDIHQSEKRIQWSSLAKGTEVAKYGRLYGIMPYDGDIAKFKYFVWDRLQRPPDSSFDLPYEALSKHPLFVVQAERGDFKPRQYVKTDTRRTNATC